MVDKNIEDMTDDEWRAKKQEMLIPDRREAIAALVKRIEGFVLGFKVDFSLIAGNLAASPEYAWRISDACRRTVEYWIEHLTELDTQVIDLSFRTLHNDEDKQLCKEAGERLRAIEEGNKLRVIARTKGTDNIQYWDGEEFRDGKKVIRDENGKEVRRETVQPSPNFQKWFSAAGREVTNPIAGDGVTSDAKKLTSRPVLEKPEVRAPTTRKIKG